MTDRAWTVRQRKYMETLADPTDTRDKKAIAESLGVKRQTLWNWERLEGFWEDLGKLIHELGDKGLGEIVKALWRKAARGDVAAARLYLQWAGELIERSEQKHAFAGRPEINIFIEGEDGA